jgi:hypothetical protein
MKADKYLRAAEKAMEQQIVPLLFSAAQQQEWAQPHHEKWDHYNFASLMTADKRFEDFAQVAPQLAINDPRITQAQIDAAPKTLKVVVDGTSYDVPLRIYKNTSETEQQWQESRRIRVRHREVVQGLEKSLKAEFKLTAGKDYSIGTGRSLKDGKPVDTFMVQLFNAKARKAGPELQKRMTEQLAVLMPERPSNVWLMGPIVLH